MKNYILVLLFAVLFITASAPAWGRAAGGPAPTPTRVTEEQKTCSTIEEQIEAAEAVEDYAKARYEGHRTGNDYWACHYAVEAYDSACHAREYLEYLNASLCDALRTPSICSLISSLNECNQPH